MNSLATQAKRIPVFEQEEQESEAAPAYQYHEAELGSAQKKL